MTDFFFQTKFHERISRTYRDFTSTFKATIQKKKIQNLSTQEHCKYFASSMKYQVSSNKYQVACSMCQVACIMYQVACIMYQAACIMYTEIPPQ